MRQTPATSQRRHGGQVWGRCPNPRDQVTWWLPHAWIQGSGVAVRASPLVLPPSPPPLAPWGWGGLPSRAQQPGLRWGPERTCPEHGGEPWARASPTVAIPCLPRPTLPLELLQRRSPPAMAWGSAEHSCTSTTQQSRAALSFFSLEADGATRKRPCR